MPIRIDLKISSPIFLVAILSALLAALHEQTSSVSGVETRKSNGKQLRAAEFSQQHIDMGEDLEPTQRLPSGSRHSRMTRSKIPKVSSTSQPARVQLGNKKSKSQTNRTRKHNSRTTRLIDLSSSSAENSTSGGSKCALILQRTYVRRRTDNSEFYDSGQAGISNRQKEDPQFFHVTDKKERICITYSQLNQAIAEAKKKRKFVSIPDEQVSSIEPKVPIVSELGELSQEVTKILAKNFDLSVDEIQKGLPMIDMSRTDFWQICPLMVRPVECDPLGRFRSFTGHCNNLKNPTWGAAQTPFVRFLDPQHPDGIQAERRSALDDSPLPSPRLVTSIIHRDQDQPSGDLSLLIMSWGQIIDHDLALAAPPRDERGLDFNCCKRQHPNCKPIQIPERDPLYSRFNQRCMDFKRSLAGLRPNCALGPRVHINTITATIDANTIYGSTKAIADQLRTYSRGQLKVQNVFKDRKPLMTQQFDRPDLDCFERPDNTFCFFGGDERVNEQPTLTALHTLYVRDHNRLASKLASINPHWDDDRIYHETRHIQAALAQHLVISEYLPLLIGHDMMVLYNLTEAPTNSYWEGYDPEVSPAISHGFSTAAFRQGHTFIQGRVHLFDSKTHRHLGFEMLRNLFKRPFHFYEPGRLDQIVAGIINTPAQTYDPFVTEEISGHLFQEPGELFGMDLPAINLARGREQGTPGYNVFREWCGLPRAEKFEDLKPYMQNRTAFLYSKLYKHVDDIDLWSGGVSERRMSGSQIGPTFACIIARQFANIKRGDRFWYENSGFPSAFTLPQIREIRKATQARLLCYNSDSLHMIQRNALRLPHPIYNPRVPCSSIPDLDLNYWLEDPENLGSFKLE